MKVTENVVRTYTLEMSESEALWLQNIMQNPFYDRTPDQEDADIRFKRLSLFTALSDVL